MSDDCAKVVGGLQLAILVRVQRSRRKIAAVTEWKVFVEHWDDFCYCASDAVTVVALAGAWTFCYRHDDLFQFVARPAAA